MRLPIIVGMGGVNAAGRTSGFQSFRRIVLEDLASEEQEKTLVGLAVMMGLVTPENEQYFREKSGAAALTAAEVANKYGQQIRENTLVRRIGTSYFDVDALHWQSKASLSANGDDNGSKMQFTMAAAQVPARPPANWTIAPIDGETVAVTVSGALDVKIDNVRDFAVKAAGQLPSGFDPSQLYNSRFQPRGLQLALFGATDALRSVGIEWDTILSHINPDQVGVYSSSGFGQMDQNAYGGLHQARMKGERVTTKALTMGVNSMPTDFINAYVLANVGIASSSVAACATFLSNLRHAVSDLQSGKVRVAMVGNSEAPIVPEIIDGFGTMGALATDENMMKVYGGGTVDHRRASRPFAENCGFTIGEGSQYFMLMDDALALELGAPCLGAVSDVFIDADGIKKSITAPGPGNHITMAKAAAAAAALVGERALQQKSFVMAHGSSTPQNRVTESQIFDQVAAAFGIESWPVVAIKAYVGHTIAPASGDQLAAALGAFKYGILPGIHTIDEVASDVFQDRLKLGREHIRVAPDDLEVAILNSKGFGGNNASSVILSPGCTEKMLAKRHGASALGAYLERRQVSMENADDYYRRADRGDYAPIYRFGENMLDENDIDIDRQRIKIKGQANDIQLPTTSPYSDMT